MDITALIASLMASLSDVATLRELIVIAVVLVTAALLARALRQRRVRPALQEQGAKRLAFPLTAVLLLFVARVIAFHLGWKLHLIGIAIQLMLAMAGVRIVVFALRNVFAPSGWLANFERSAATLIWCAVALDILGVLPEIIQWLDSYSLHIGKGHISLWQILQGLTTVVVTVITALWLGGIVDARLHAAQGLDSSLRVVFSRIVKALLLFVAVLLGMSLVGLDITTLSVFGGALGVGLGLGMQKIASNYVSGFIILLDRSIRIGNLIQIGADTRGEVLQITTRYTVLGGGNGTHFIVPNELLVGAVVQNETFTLSRMRVAIVVPVAYGQDTERALQILEEVAAAEKRVLEEPAPRASLAEFTDVGIKLELGVWINDPLQGTLSVRSNIQRAVLARFIAEGIDMPQPKAAAKQLPGASV
ncbi:mechanosensitive ion channel domain-containing protein [Uliginosibacterium sp. H3]|uniref:Mechanosensitive ion channel domain-containing protein n=1 Tax=Uliginosibacterium silvisoli TaxID=3114758 RepID=A0ABU6K714_9RHOO|nr:mechanosensitive ion channel domain-containing protein [Uliginosibacterium sp. H3]